jgi:hypothetical protein
MAVSVVALCFIAFIATRLNNQPSHQGKSLDWWLLSVHEKGLSRDFYDAIDAMGTNSLPLLLTYSIAIDSNLKIRTAAFFKEKLGLNLPFDFAEIRRGPALAALMHLGPKASPIVPQLVGRFEEHPFTALFPLVFIQHGSDSAFISLCENKDQNARVAAAEGLARVQNGIGYAQAKQVGLTTTNVLFQMYLTKGDNTMQWIANNLSHSNHWVRRASAEYFAVHPGLAAPILPQLRTVEKDDESPIVREAAKRAISVIQAPRQ